MGIGLGVSIQTGMLQVELPLGVMLCSLAVLPLLCYALIIVADSYLKNLSVKVALLSVPASFIQLIGYGSGFIRAWWKRCVCSKREFSAFEKNFYE